jgi:protein Mpv17
MGIWRAFLFAPLAHGFYVLVDRVVPYTGWRGVAVKVAIDQLLYASPMTMSFFVTDALLEGCSPQEAWDRGAAIIWDVTKMTWSVWPFVQMFNFAVVPMQHRVVFVSVVATVWSVYLSLMNESTRGTKRGAAS